MIPPDYVCSKCKVTGVKLWRQYQTLADRIELMCYACAEKDQKRLIDLSVGDQCGWLVPAVPTLDGTWWGYTSVPPEGCAWWDALPLKPEGNWRTKKGWACWLPYRTGMDWSCRTDDVKLLRIDNWTRRTLVLFTKCRCL